MLQDKMSIDDLRKRIIDSGDFYHAETYSMMFDKFIFKYNDRIRLEIWNSSGEALLSIAIKNDYGWKDVSTEDVLSFLDKKTAVKLCFHLDLLSLNYIG